jgi:hypothetical protein
LDEKLTPPDSTEWVDISNNLAYIQERIAMTLNPLSIYYALLWALREGIISYAGLDVFEEEPLPKTHPLIETKNTILTPHIAAFVKTTQKKMMESIVRDIANYIDGKPMEKYAVVVAKPAKPRKPKSQRGSA